MRGRRFLRSASSSPTAYQLLTGRMNPVPSDWPQEMATYISSTLKWTLQRVPFLTHIAILLLGIVGPLFMPRLVALICVATHVVFVLCQARSAYGVFCAWRGVKEWGQIDWDDEWQKGTKEARQRGESVLHYRDVKHCIVLPAYKEEISTIRETLDILASHPLAATMYSVCLGMEEREAGAISKAQSIVKSYRAQGAFDFIDFSLHPGNILGESAGKSSNVNWAARYLSEQLPEWQLPSAILTVMDADTAFAADFFLSAAVKFSVAVPEIRERMLFVPPTVFDRNSHDVPIFTRTTDIFWSCAGIGGSYPSAQCKIPTSAYAASMGLVKFCGFWDAGPEAIGEDLHFYCKALFETKGNLHAATIYSPASQCNVVGAAAKGPIGNYVNDMRARWSQATRHLWGSLDWGYTWHRVLTGAFGQSDQNAAAYIAVSKDVQHGRPIRESDDSISESFELRPVTIDSPLVHIQPTIDSLMDSRTPSPAASSSYSTDDTLVEQMPLKKTKAGRRASLPPRQYGPSPRFLMLPLEDVEIEEDVEAVVKIHDSIDDGVGDNYNFAEEPLLPEVLVNDSAQPLLRRAFRIVVLLTRLYEAHLMVAHVFLIMFMLTLFPAVIHRNGTISVWSKWNRVCTWNALHESIFITPFATTVEVPDDVPPGLQPIWMMPDIVHCAIKASRFLGFWGIVATLLMLILHDFYHHQACTLRWQRSDDILQAWRNSGSVGPVPLRYLGIRPKEISVRNWPWACLDWAAVPAGLLYGILPLLYAQLNHMVTNKMTYVVSAKGKGAVVVPLTTQALRRSMDVTGASAGGPRTSLTIGRPSFHGVAREGIPLPAFVVVEEEEDEEGRLEAHVELAGRGRDGSLPLYRK